MEQRNPYQGTPERPWLRLQLGSGGRVRALDVLADTGNPCPLILSAEDMRQFKQSDAPDVDTNFGLLEGGWVEIEIPDLQYHDHILGYASDEVFHACQASHSSLRGLAGLPLLRQFEYGGDANSFWLRSSGQ